MGVLRELLGRVSEGAVLAPGALAAILYIHAHLRLRLRAVNPATLPLPAAVDAAAHRLQVLRRQLPVRRARVVVDVVRLPRRGDCLFPARRQDLRGDGHERALATAVVDEVVALVHAAEVSRWWWRPRRGRMPLLLYK